MVSSLEASSPAALAGVERGDVILRVGDTIVRRIDDYARAVRAIPHGKPIALLVARKEARNLWLTFDKR